MVDQLFNIFTLNDSWELLYNYVFQQWHNTSILEMIAVVLGALQVILAYRNHVSLYPAGIVSTSIFIYLFAQYGLYAEASLNLYYFIMSIYGWFLWLHPKNKEQKELNITHTNSKELLIAFSILITSFLLLFLVLSKFTDSTIPYLDATVSAFAWAGMWLLAKRKLSNWVLLNISNAIAIPMLFYKSMPLTACLTIFYFVIAIFGYFRWRKIMRREQTSP